jgi:hypothetical protein
MKKAMNISSLGPVVPAVGLENKNRRKVDESQSWNSGYPKYLEIDYPSLLPGTQECVSCKGASVSCFCIPPNVFCSR